MSGSVASCRWSENTVPTSKTSPAACAEAVGAVLAGRRTVEQVDHWGGDNHGLPIFVPSHRPPGPSVANYPLVTYVADGIESAIAQAKAAAGDRNVMVLGAYTAQRALKAGGLDELQKSDPGAVRSWSSTVRGVAVARRVGDRSGDRHAGGHTHPRPRPSLGWTAGLRSPSHSLPHASDPTAPAARGSRPCAREARQGSGSHAWSDGA
jgi:hypothetical protein